MDTIYKKHYDMIFWQESVCQEKNKLKKKRLTDTNISNNIQMKNRQKKIKK